MLPNELYYEIGSYLSLIDLWKLMNLNKEIREYSQSIGFDMQTEFKEYFIRHLKYILKDPGEFCNNLKKYNCVVSGPFIMDCIYGRKSLSDINIFQYQNTEFLEYLLNLTKVAKIIKPENWLMFKQRMIGVRYSYEPELITNVDINIDAYNISEIYHLFLGKTKFQFILINEDYGECANIMYNKYIYKEFFDGEKLIKIN